MRLGITLAIRLPIGIALLITVTAVTLYIQLKLLVLLTSFSPNHAVARQLIVLKKKLENIVIKKDVISKLENCMIKVL